MRRGRDERQCSAIHNACHNIFGPTCDFFRPGTAAAEKNDDQHQKQQKQQPNGINNKAVDGDWGWAGVASVLRDC